MASELSGANLLCFLGSSARWHRRVHWTLHEGCYR